MDIREAYIFVQQSKAHRSWYTEQPDEKHAKCSDSSKQFNYPVQLPCDSKAGIVLDYFLYGKLPVENPETVYKTFKECIMENGQLYKVEYKNGVMRQCLWIPESKVKDIIYQKVKYQQK